MSGGAGHLLDMIHRLRGNNSLLKKPGYFKIKEELLKVSGKTVYEFKHASPKQIKRIRKKLIRQRKLHFAMTVTKLFLSVIGAVLIVGLLIYWFVII